MDEFVQRHRDAVIGVLSGFDRLRFRGTLRWLCYGAGLGRCLSALGIRLTRFKEYLQAVTARMRASSEGVARAAGRPIECLSKPSLSKEGYARAGAARDGIRAGLIAVLHAVEPCCSFRIGREARTGLIEVSGAGRKCTHYYSYGLDPEGGFCHVRMQTWFPLSGHVCINGRAWLGRQMDRAGPGYQRRANCFVRVQDVARTQALLDEQLHVDWAPAPERLLARAHPHYATIPGLTARAGYYWSADASARATDVLFRSAAALRAHGLIRKVPKTHRYVLSPNGRLAIAALLAARAADTKKLVGAA